MQNTKYKMARAGIENKESAGVVTGLTAVCTLQLESRTLDSFPGGVIAGASLQEF